MASARAAERRRRVGACEGSGGPCRGRSASRRPIRSVAKGSTDQRGQPSGQRPRSSDPVASLCSSKPVRLRLDDRSPERGSFWSRPQPTRAVAPQRELLGDARTHLREYAEKVKYFNELKKLREKELRKLVCKFSKELEGLCEMGEMDLQMVMDRLSSLMSALSNTLKKDLSSFESCPPGPPPSACPSKSRLAARPAEGATANPS
jgi:hypothetical protein